MFIYLFFFQRRISELPLPIGAKVGHVVGSRL